MGKSLGRTGLLYVGNNKLGARHGWSAPSYRKPLPLPLPAAALIIQALTSASLTPISQPDADGPPVRDDAAQPVVSAEEGKTSVELTCAINGHSIT